MKRTALVVGVFALAGCHGIAHPTEPDATPTVLVPAKLAIVATPGELPIGGGSALFKVEVLTLAGVGVPNTAVTLSASGGTLAASNATTDNSGHAGVQWFGTQTATVTASVGDMIAASTIPVNVPAATVPPSQPRPPIPQPTPEPLPTPAPEVSVGVTASPLQVAAGAPVTLTVDASNLLPGESVTAYQWSWEGGPAPTIDETSIGPSRSHIYATDGVRAPQVSIITSSGRRSAGTGRVIVYKP